MNALLALAMFLPSWAASNPTTEANAKLCLASLYTIEKTYQQKHKKFADDISELDLSTANICGKFQVFVLEGSKDKFKMRLQSSDTAWTVDETKTMTKLR